MKLIQILSFLGACALFSISASDYDAHTTITRDTSTTREYVVHHHPSSAHLGKAPRWAEFLKFAGSKYGLSLGAGAATGALCAVGCRVTNKYMPWFVSWIIWTAIRNKAVSSIEADLKQFNIPHSQGLLVNGAWAADWLTYLAFSPNPTKTYMLLLQCLQ